MVKANAKAFIFGNGPEKRHRIDKAADDAARELSSQVEHLGRLVIASEASGDELRDVFRVATSDGASEIDRHLSLREFSRLPLRVQIRILNGWKPSSNPPTHQEAVEQIDNSYEVHPVLAVHVGPEHVMAFDTYELHPAYDAVVCRIMHGTPKREALSILRGLVCLLENHWDEMIDSGDEGFNLHRRDLDGEQKSGTPDNSHIAPSGIQSDAWSNRPTAAVA